MKVATKHKMSQQTTFCDASVQKNDEDFDAVKQDLHEARQTIVKLKEETKSKDILISSFKKGIAERDEFKKERLLFRYKIFLQRK
jgi:hypothetical protein